MKIAVHVKNQDESKELQEFLFLRNYTWKSNGGEYKLVQNEPINKYENNSCIIFSDFIDVKKPSIDERSLTFTYTEYAKRRGFVLIPLDFVALEYFLSTGDSSEIVKKYSNYINGGFIVKKNDSEEEPNPREIL